MKSWSKDLKFDIDLAVNKKSTIEKYMQLAEKGEIYWFVFLSVSGKFGGMDIIE